MSKFYWDESMSVGVEEIDGQHRQLLRMFHGLEEAMKEGRGRDELTSLMHGLAEYAIQHFSTEERLMQQTEYPDFLQHHVEHQQFVAKVLDFNKKHQQGNVLLTTEIVIFLREWIISHIRETDQRCRPHFANAGLD